MKKILALLLSLSMFGATGLMAADTPNMDALKEFKTDVEGDTHAEKLASHAKVMAAFYTIDAEKLATEAGDKKADEMKKYNETHQKVREAGRKFLKSLKKELQNEDKAKEFYKAALGKEDLKEGLNGTFGDLKGKDNVEELTTFLMISTAVKLPKDEDIKKAKDALKETRDEHGAKLYTMYFKRYWKEMFSDAAEWTMEHKAITAGIGAGVVAAGVGAAALYQISRQKGFFHHMKVRFFGMSDAEAADIANRAVSATGDKESAKAWATGEYGNSPAAMEQVHRAIDAN